MKLPQYYTASEVAKIFRRDPHTIRDWINLGCPTPSGRVKLKAIKLGKFWTIKDEWLSVFELSVRSDPREPDLELEYTQPETQNGERA